MPSDLEITLPCFGVKHEFLYDIGNENLCSGITFNQSQEFWIEFLGDFPALSLQALPLRGQSLLLLCGARWRDSRNSSSNCEMCFCGSLLWLSAFMALLLQKAVLMPQGLDSLAVAYG